MTPTPATRERLLFLHIPKTAGTSMRHYLTSQYPPDEVLPATNWNEFVARGLDSANYRLYAGHFRSNFRYAVPAGTRVLTILREPISRYVSHLRHARADDTFDVHATTLRGMSIAEIIRKPRYAYLWGNIQTRWLSRSAPVAAVSALLRQKPDADPTSVEAKLDIESFLHSAKTTLMSCDFIGFAEDLDEVMNEMCVRMGFRPSAPFPVKLPVKHVEPPPLLTEDDLKIIRDLNSADIALYSYAQRLKADGNITLPTHGVPRGSSGDS